MFRSNQTVTYRSNCRYVRQGLPCSSARRSLLIPVLWIAYFGATACSIQGQSCEASLAGGFPPEVRAILSLASSDSLQREQSRAWLARQGLEAWDWLTFASNSKDPEIQLAATRIKTKIDWQLSLSRIVPELAGYDQQNRFERERVIIYLGSVGDLPSRTALAMIARMDDDEQLARLAAVEIITRGQPVRNLRSAIGISQRVPCEWLRVYHDSLEPIEFSTTWRTLIQPLLQGSQQFDSSATSQRLVRWFAEQLWSQGSEIIANEIVGSMINHQTTNEIARIETLDWLLFNRRFDLCRMLIEKNREHVDSDPGLLAREAEVVWQSGERERSEVIFTRAMEVSPAEELIRIQMAVNWRSAGLNRWARKLLECVVSAPKGDPSAKCQAADLLSSICFEAGDIVAARMAVEVAIELHPQNDRLLLTGKPELKTRYYLYSHLEAVSKRDLEAAKQFLLTGLDSDPGNTELLLAMHKFRPSFANGAESNRWQETSRQLIELALVNRATTIESLRFPFDRDARQKRIREADLVNALNSYAWLASQSGLSLDKAETYARESAELAPRNANVLDTLAATLFAQSRITEAIETQKLAVRESPWSLPIRRELVRFQNARTFANLPAMFR